MSAIVTANDPIRKLLETASEQIEKNELREAAQTLNKAQQIWPNDARVFMFAGLMAGHKGPLQPRQTLVFPAYENIFTERR